MQQLKLVPSVREILESVQAQVCSRGLQHASLLHPHSGEEVYFDVLEGIRFHDHGARQRGLSCCACSNGHNLRYEFEVTTLDGKKIGPIGSDCIFRRVLGEERSRSIQSALKGHIDAHTRQTFAERHQQKLEEAESWRAYLRAEGFEAALLAMASGRGADPTLLQKLERLCRSNKPLTSTLIKELREAFPAETSRPAVTPARHAPKISRSAFQAVDPGVARSTPLRGRSASGRALPPKEWQKYVQERRLTLAIKGWEALAPLVDVTPEELADIRYCLTHHHVLPLELLSPVQQAIKSAPRELRQSVESYVNDGARSLEFLRKRDQEIQEKRRRRDQRAALERKDAQEQKLRKLETERIIQNKLNAMNQRLPEGAKRYIRADQTSIFPKVRIQWDFLCTLLPLDTANAMAEAMGNDFLIQEDHWEKVRVICLATENPQRVKALRTMSGFQILVAAIAFRSSAQFPVPLRRDDIFQLAASAEFSEHFANFSRGGQVSGKKIVKALRKIVGPLQK